MDNINPDIIPLPIAIPLIVILFAVWIFLIIRDRRAAVKARRRGTWIAVNGQWRRVVKITPIDLTTKRFTEIFDQDADSKEKDGITASR